MKSEIVKPKNTQQKVIISYFYDLPNILSLAGLACTLIAIYFIVLGTYPAAMIGMIWAVAFDWADGLVARRMKGRTASDGLFGGQLDVLIDIVSYGVTPALLFLFEGMFGSGAFSVILYAVGLGLAALNVSQISTPKLSGNPVNVVLLAAYTLAITAIFGWKLL